MILKNKINKSGLAALPSILVIATVALVAGLSMASGGLAELSISQEQLRSQESFYIAESGIADALIKITRNKKFENVGYALSIGEGNATIIIQKGIPVAGQTTIFSTGSVKNGNRKIQAIVNVDNNGKVTMASWNEYVD
jgi:hypothetical protein